MKGERLEDLQRVGFYDGALLRARDLGASVSYELTLHRLHTGVLHRTWGIAEGLEVRLRGEQLLVASGLAYDICGRAILLGTLAELIVPPTADGYVVAICADEVCPSPRWRAPGELRLGRDVPLARLARDGAGPWLDLAPRRYVQPFGRPRIAAGEEELALDATLLRGGWRTFPIDTATADFVETPAYF
ncbi:MAG TPA: hypothetical protein VGJ87_12975, partial [Roseiflexaceae bacterium]